MSVAASRLAPAFVAFAAVAALPGSARAGSGFRVPSDTRQLVIVTSADFAATTARLVRFERGRRGPWRPVGTAVDVVLGKGGLGWGRGLFPVEETSPAGPRKREGDGRAPAGVFRLVEATGYAEAPPRGAKLRYRRAGDRLRCVDDTSSSQYNQIVEAPADAPPTWTSAEEMRRADALYEWVVVVEHNRDPAPVPGSGSCIFLHVWRGPAQPTVGCTAMPPERMRDLLAWLDGGRRPLLVQMPRSEYAAVARAAGLPTLPAGR